MRKLFILFLAVMPRIAFGAFNTDSANVSNLQTSAAAELASQNSQSVSITNLFTSATAATVRGIYSSMGSSGAITNTASQQTFSFAQSTGSLTVSFAAYQAGATAQLRIDGVTTAPILGLGTTLNVRLKNNGSTELFSSGDIPLAVNLGTKALYADIYITLISKGTSGQVSVQGNGVLQTGLFSGFFSGGPNLITLNTANPLVLTVTTTGSGATNQAASQLTQFKMYPIY